MEIHLRTIFWQNGASDWIMRVCVVLGAFEDASLATSKGFFGFSEVWDPPRGVGCVFPLLLWSYYEVFWDYK